MKQNYTLGLPVLVLLMVALLYGSVAQDGVPQRVREAFAIKFMNITPLKWDRESSTEWEAQFKIKGVRYSANFTADGTWQETEHEIKKKNIPKAIKKVLDSRYPTYKIDEAEISETREGVFYEIELKQGASELEVLFDKEGAVIKELVEDSDTMEEPD